jgi:hypothetical protein
MNKEYAKSIGKFDQLKKAVLEIKKEMENPELDDPIEMYKFLDSIIKYMMATGHKKEDADWVIAYATGLEELE